MKGNRFTEDQIIGFVKQAGAGLPVKALCRRVECPLELDNTEEIN